MKTEGGGDKGGGWGVGNNVVVVVCVAIRKRECGRGFGPKTETEGRWLVFRCVGKNEWKGWWSGLVGCGE